MTNNGTYPGGQPGALSIKDLDALRAAATQFRDAGDTITGLQANTSIAGAVSGGLPGTDIEKGVANVDETLSGALKNQGQWLDGLAGKLLGALDQIAQVDQGAAAALAQDAPAQTGGSSGGGDSGGGGDSSSGGSGSGGGDSGGGSSGGGSGSGSGGGSPSGGSGSGSQPESAAQGQGQEQPSDEAAGTGAQEAAQPVDGLADDGSGDGETMSIVGPDGNEVKLSPEQTKNAKAIIEAGKQLGVSDGGVQSALQTALQESGLHNYGSTEYPESLQYADKKPDGSPWLSNDQNMVGLFPHDTGARADVQTMMDPYTQAAGFFERHDLTSGSDAATNRAQSV